jgi:hypothetical protein
MSSDFFDRFEADHPPAISEEYIWRIKENSIVESFSAAVVSRFQQLEAIENRDQRIVVAFNRSLALLTFPTTKGQKNRIDPLKEKQGALCRLLKISNPDEQIKLLLKCKGPGVMIAQYIASKNIFTRARRARTFFSRARRTI